MVPTGLKVAIPAGYEGQIRARSSLGRKGLILPHSIGTIDADYRGELFVLMTWIEREFVYHRKGERIAQMVIAPIPPSKFTEVNLESLGDTERGEGGFSAQQVVSESKTGNIYEAFLLLGVRSGSCPPQSIDELRSTVTAMKAKGLNSQQIADELSLSQTTIQWLSSTQQPVEDHPADIRVGWRSIAVKGERIEAVSEIFADIMMEEIEARLTQ